MKTILVLAVLVCVSLTVSAQTNDFFCDICVGLASMIQKYIQKEIPLDKIERDAELFCGVLPGEWKDFCETKLIPDVDQMYNQLNNTSDSPQQVCELLDFCETN